MTAIIISIIALCLGSLLLLVSGGFIIYYIVTKKGKLGLSIAGLCLSIVLLGGGFCYVIYASVSKAQEQQKQETKSRRIVNNTYSLTSRQKRILDTKTFETSNSADKTLIIQAAACIFKDKKEQAKYEPKIKEFYIKYMEDSGLTEEEAIQYYEQTREQVKKLERSIK